MTDHNNIRAKKIRVLFISSEADPIIKVGGLGDVIGTLPHHLAHLSPQEVNGFEFEIRIAIPFYPTLSQTFIKDKRIISFSIPYWEQEISGWAYVSSIQDIPVYLVSGAPINDVNTIYSIDSNRDMEKFIFFSLGALEICKQESWKPDIVHAHDWHSATAVYALAIKRTSDPFFRDSRSILTIHNLPFMGGNAPTYYPKFGLPINPGANLPEWANQFVLSLGLSKADVITTVSPTYAREIQTAEFGRGLETYLNSRQDSVYGILNGLDKDQWDPEMDKSIPQNFNKNTLARKRINSEALLTEFNMKLNKGGPLLVSIGRMEEQKGFDLILQTLRRSLDLPWQAIVMGTGNPAIEAECKEFEFQYPDRFKAIIQFNPVLARKIYAGGDILMMPSRYEPCGLCQMIAMRYGCIPLARSTGGLKDTIVDDPSLKTSTGFLFDQPTAKAMSYCLNRAVMVFSNRAIWKKIQKNAMQKDFSWSESALAYARIYLDLFEQAQNLPYVNTKLISENQG